MRVCVAALGICLLFMVACKKEHEHSRNMVDFEQIEPDNSTNYWYIFRDEIREEQMREKKKRQPF